ncbi:MAG: ABC transporter permease [Gemmatimonadetes bacterium]|nr:ABC transporter permease [Gemmatimonadota bacterium]
MNRKPTTLGRRITGLWEGLVIAFWTMRDNLVRTGLTILGVAVGVSVVVAIAALVVGIRTSVVSAVESAGPDNFSVVRFDFTAVRISDEGNNRPPWWNKPQITPEEARRIRTLPAVQEALYTMDFGVGSMEALGNRVREAQGSAVSSGWSAYSPGDFIAGRDFTESEVSASRAVVVISEDLATELFGERDPIGQRVRVSTWRTPQVPFTVVGVYRMASNIFSDAFGEFAVFPWSTVRKRLRESFWQARIDVVPADSVTKAEAEDQVITELRQTRRLHPADENNFALLSSQQILDLFNQITGILFLVMLGLTSVGLLVGGVGVIGIMLISVTERTKEIGVRKALGATRGEVLWQFLTEASALTVAGAAVGILAGWGIAEGVARWTPIPAQLQLWSVAVALAMAALTGILFGLAPALKASRLDPVEALRRE